MSNKAVTTKDRAERAERERAERKKDQLTPMLSYLGVGNRAVKMRPKAEKLVLVVGVHKAPVHAKQLNGKTKDNGN